MEKALEKIKEIIDFCDVVGCHRAIYESIKFVEKELEEAMNKTCEGCEYVIKYPNGCHECCLLTYADQEGCTSCIEVDKDFYCNKYKLKYNE